MSCPKSIEYHGYEKACGKLDMITTLGCHMCHTTTVERELIAACKKMLEVTGGSGMWNGETHDALKMIEDAVEKWVDKVNRS